MKAWAEFYDDLLPIVPGCPTLMADFQLRRAAQEWCDRTLCWREWLDDVTTVADTDTYDFEITAAQDIVQLLRATLDGQHIDTITPDKLPANWRSTDSTCERGIFTLDRLTFTLVPTPAAGVIVQTEVALKPSNAATGVIDEILRQYSYQIALGAAARLHAMPGKPYSLNSTARAEFENAIAQTASDVDKAFSRAAPRVRAHFI